MFPNEKMDGLQCVPCITANTKKGPIKTATNDARPLAEIHFDLSGPMLPSVGGNVYATHFIEPRTAKSDVITINDKGQIKNFVAAYIATV